MAMLSMLKYSSCLIQCIDPWFYLTLCNNIKPQFMARLRYGSSSQLTHYNGPWFFSWLKSYCNSAAQPFSHPLTFNFPWSLGYIRKLVFMSPWETISLPVLCAANIWCPGISKEIYFLCPEKFMLGQSRIELGTSQSQSNMLPLDQCTLH